ncbi:MAG: PTS sugar transporter subunit IIA, partial [FCB group bacterium]|nr:PTS sugar transporter subunit IIA [FCB group bacterium]
LQELLNEQNVVQVQSSTWEAAIVELTQYLQTSGQMPEFDSSILTDVINQESCNCSMADRGLAYPHIYSDDFEATTIILGVSKTGIEYDSPDGLPCQIILMTISPDNKDIELERFLSLFRTMIQNSGIRLKIIEAEDAGEILDIINSWETEQLEIDA